MRLSIIIPMYNEEAGCELCVRTVLRNLPTDTVETHLFIVDDGSKDKTSSILSMLLLDGLTFSVITQNNLGYGAAIVKGAQVAAQNGFDYALFMDSDLTNPPHHISRFVPFILAKYDLIKGDRFKHPDGLKAVAWNRKVYSLIGNFIARAMFRMSIKDLTNGFRAIRLDCFLQMPLDEKGFPIILQEMYYAKKNKISVISVPTVLGCRNEDLRPTMFTYDFKTIWNYLKYALKASIIF